MRAAAVAGGHRAAAQMLSPAGADAVLGDAGLAPGGAAVVLWRSGVAGADPAGTAKPAVVAAMRPAADAAFGAPELVSEPGEDVREAPAGAIDPRSAGALAVYADVYPGSVRASARP
ncbi:MAG: hypothetical protein ACXVFT_12810 [Solirubrobacteraceae bacterium]